MAILRIVTYSEFDETIAFGHAQGDLAVFLGVGYCRDFLAASVLTTVVISITTIIVGEYIRLILLWQHSEHFITPIIGAI